VNTVISGILIIILIAVFVGIFAWAYAPRHKQRFIEAARLPLADDRAPPPEIVIEEQS
jgi:cytochrome c oxidase cbb3-type subunit IV